MHLLLCFSHLWCIQYPDHTLWLLVSILISTLRSKGSQWGPVDLIFPSVYLSISLYLCLYVYWVFCIAFWWTFARTLIARSTYGLRSRFPQYNIYISTFSPHWGPEETVGVQLSLYVCLYLRISLSMSLCISVLSPTSLFVYHLTIPQFRAAHAATGHRSKSPEWQYNMSSHPYFQSFARLLRFFCINFQCGGPESQLIFPHTGVQRTPVGSSPAYMSVSLSLCLVVCIDFLQ